ncbi:hypothetical protein H4R19_002213 [Coemansia spiralis]|nr:hypothetical protein H4R19_002213 [Coemansia spiralis]
MRLSLIVIQALAMSALAAPALLRRQDIAAASGDSVSGGPAAVSNPNVNNGEQTDSSLIVSGGASDGDFINNAFGNSITHVNSNQANKGNLVINPSFTTSDGNSGATANGNQNHLGDSQDMYPGLWRRDVVFNNGRPHAQPVAAPPGAVQLVARPPGHVNANHQDASIVQNQA